MDEEHVNEGFMLTTFDNPFDPFDDFKKWFMFDVEKGYNSCSRLARIAKLSDDMSEDEIEAETNRAIDEIIMYDPLNIYTKVTQKDEKSSNVEEIVTTGTTDDG